MVLSGVARQGFHGIPRVFTDRALPPALCCDDPGDPFFPFAQHMGSGCRVNVSVRCTL